jgi:hypothetical protein
MAREGYKQKRHFDTTPEPRPRRGKAHRRPLFVVQEHHASRLHYDLRLEAGLLLDARVVDVPRASNPTFVSLSSLKPLFFNGLKHEERLADNLGIEDPRNPRRARPLKRAPG